MPKIGKRPFLVSDSLFLFYKKPKLSANLSSAGNVSAEEVDRFPWREWSPLRDVSQWKPPRIRFVEVMKDTHKWTLAPVEKPRAAR